MFTVHHIISQVHSFRTLRFPDVIQLTLIVVPFVILWITSYLTKRKDARKLKQDKGETLIVLIEELSWLINRFHTYRFSGPIVHQKLNTTSNRISLLFFDNLEMEFEQSLYTLETDFYRLEAQTNTLTTLYFKMFYSDYEQYRNGLSAYIDRLKKDLADTKLINLICLDTNKQEINRQSSRKLWKKSIDSWINFEKTIREEIWKSP